MSRHEPKLEFVMEYVGGPSKEPESYQLWACRGERKGCKKRVLKTKRHCADCVLPDMNDTLGEILKRLERGDA